ncbi:MAG TPA: hypothetical protein VGI61_04700, partial [Parafilimonas sp.]
YNVFKGNFYNQYELYEPILKQQAFKEDTVNYNTLLIGTSKTYRQVNPFQFDSITGTKSYNLAYAGFYPFRLYDALNHILSFKKSDSLKNIVIELASLDLIEDNYNSDAYVYSIDFNKYTNAVTTIAGGSFSDIFKAQSLFYYTRLLFYKYAGFGIIKYVNNYLGIDKPAALNDPVLQNYKKFTAEHRGYIDLNMETDSLGGNDYVTRENFLKHADKIVANMIKHYPKKVDKIKADAFMNYIVQVADKLKKQERNVYFIVPPRNAAMSYLLAQRNFLIKKGYTDFDLSDPKEYPDFYKVENSYNITHLNTYGASLFTKAFAEMAKPYLNKQ